MSKLENIYEHLKRKDDKKLYLFKVGNFYIFLGSDANYINNYMVLKKTRFSNKYQKCGFPINKINDYKKVFINLKLNVKIFDNLDEIDTIEYLKKIDIENLTKKDAINLLKDIRDCYD
jgi:DNA mismatch repair ATPase MutS